MRHRWLFIFMCKAWCGPWFTGPLLSPMGHTIPKGHTNFEPYLYVTDTSGVADARWKHHGSPNSLTVNPSVIITRGWSDVFDTGFVLNLISNFDGNQSDTNIGDTSIVPAWQAMEESRVWPSLRIYWSQSFPTGKYQRLNSKKLGTDATGSGTFTSAPGMTFQKLFHFSGPRYLRVRLSSMYAIAPPVHVKGLNTYGGGFGTSGWVYPGNKWSTFLAGEFAITQNWVVVLEMMQVFTARTRFSGKRGKTDEGIVAAVGDPPSKQFSLAPAFEYNWSKNLGLIAGVWFSVWDHNARNFVSGVAAINYYH